MAEVPPLERAARTILWPWGLAWRWVWRLPPWLRVVVLASLIGLAVANTWAADHRPYDVFAWVAPPTRSPADFSCYDYWGVGRDVSGKIDRGEVVRIIHERQTQVGDWIRVAPKAGGSCWMDRYYWDEAEAKTRVQ